MISSQDYTR